MKPHEMKERVKRWYQERTSWKEDTTEILEDMCADMRDMRILLSEILGYVQRIESKVSTEPE